MDASNWSATTQLLYVKLAARHGDWRALQKHKMEPTEMMRRLFISMRAKYIAWRKRRDMEEELEDALPKFWFEISPGHWVRAKDEDAARKWADSMKIPEVVKEEERVARYIEIDTSHGCVSHGIRHCSSCGCKGCGT